MRILAEPSYRPAYLGSTPCTQHSRLARIRRRNGHDYVPGQTV